MFKQTLKLQRLNMFEQLNRIKIIILIQLPRQFEQSYGERLISAIYWQKLEFESCKITVYKFYKLLYNHCIYFIFIIINDLLKFTVQGYFLGHLIFNAISQSDTFAIIFLFLFQKT